MITISLRDEVQKAVSVEWRSFAERHPRLAEIIDRPLLIEQAVARIGDDLEYQRAMEVASVSGLAAGEVADLVARFVRDWLLRLI